MLVCAATLARADPDVRELAASRLTERLDTGDRLSPFGRAWLDR